MPHKKSAAKRLRQADKSRAVNRSARSAIKTSMKKIRGAKSREVALAELPQLFSMLDKAARKSVGNFKDNTASNWKRKAHLAIARLPA